MKKRFLVFLLVAVSVCLMQNSLSAKKWYQILSSPPSFDPNANFFIQAPAGVTNFGAQVASGGGKVFTTGTESGVGYVYIFNVDAFGYTFNTKVSGAGSALAVNKAGTRYVITSGGIVNQSNWIRVFNFNGSSWQEDANLNIAKPASPSERFGYSASISDTHVAIGAPYAYNGTTSQAGAVYVYTTNLASQVKLQASPKNNGQLGTSVNVKEDGSIITISSGAPVADYKGAAYVFRKTGSTFSQIQKLQPSEGSQMFYEIGFSVSANGNNLVVGADLYDFVSGDNKGKAYVYDLTTWGFISLVYTGAVAQSQFGHSCSIDGANIGITAKNFNPGLNPPAGRFYWFKNLNGVWSQMGMATATAGAPNRHLYGNTCAVYGDVAVVSSAENKIYCYSLN